MIKMHPELIQGSSEWMDARCGLLTASQMKLIITPKTLAYANNDKEKAHLYELVAQRVTKYVEPQYISDDMLRGQTDEWDAKDLYSKNYAPVENIGFVTNDKWGFVIGCSPDGLVGDDGGIQCKSRRQKFQMETISTGKMPDDFIIQVQTELLVTERKWWDFVSYSGGMPLFVKRVYPDDKVQEAIATVAALFETKAINTLKAYNDNLKSEGFKLIPTERRVEQEMHL